MGPTNLWPHILNRSLLQIRKWKRTHKHTHTKPFYGPLGFCPGLPRWAGIRKVKPGRQSQSGCTGARDGECQWHQLGHMQMCTLTQSHNHASTPPLSFLQARCPFCHPTNSVKALKAAIKPKLVPKNAPGCTISRGTAKNFLRWAQPLITVPYPSGKGNIMPLIRLPFTNWAPHLLLTTSGTGFHRAMHYSAKRGIAIACRLSVCLSVCPSVTFVDHDHIVWKSWKLIARSISATSSLFVAQRSSTYLQGNMEKFWGD